MPRIALTDRFCLGAKSKTPQTDYFDSNTPGLALRVSSAGYKSWTLHYTSPRTGKRTRYKLGTYPAMALAKARREAIAARQQVEDGADPGSTASTAELTFAGLVNLY